MFLSREELIEEIEHHIRKSGGRFGEWSIGTAKDCRGPFFERHLVSDLGDGLAYREPTGTGGKRGRGGIGQGEPRPYATGSLLRARHPHRFGWIICQLCGYCKVGSFCSCQSLAVMTY